MGFKTVCGFGVNDADYHVNALIDGKRCVCPFYRKWYDMISRCYRDLPLKRNKTYLGCSVCEDWIVFSNFKKWMESQDWQGKQLDKDIILKGNKIYAPEVCAFVDSITNSFVTESSAIRGDFPLGVSRSSSGKSYQSACGNPFTKKTEHLGKFQCQNLAHQAWKKRKHELACKLADLQTDERVAQALRTRYL